MDVSSWLIDEIWSMKLFVQAKNIKKLVDVEWCFGRTQNCCFRGHGFDAHLGWHFFIFLLSDEELQSLSSINVTCNIQWMFSNINLKIQLNQIYWKLVLKTHILLTRKKVWFFLKSAFLKL